MSKYSHLTNLLQKLKYGGFTRLFLDGLSKCQITVAPYILFREDIPEHPVTSPDIVNCDYEIEYLTHDDMVDIAAIPHRSRSSDYLQGLIQEGKMCLALKHQGRLVAFTWCDLNECTFRGHRFRLKDNEAYLFDMYTIQKYRGKGIAPYLRFQLYRELKKLGRVKLYSVSGYLNKSAVKFKDKLGAKQLKLGIYINLFEWKKFSIPIRRY